MSADTIRPVPTINLTADELAAVTAAIRRAIEDDRFPHAPRLDLLKAALGKMGRPQSQPRSRKPRCQLPKSGRGDKPAGRSAVLSHSPEVPP